MLFREGKAFQDWFRTEVPVKHVFPQPRLPLALADHGREAPPADGDDAAGADPPAGGPAGVHEAAGVPEAAGGLPGVPEAAGGPP